jgi:RNA recognition motif-containing protein
MTEEVIRDHFSQYDTVVNVRIMKDRKTKGSKGYAFVTVTDHLKIPNILCVPQVIEGRTVDVQVASRRGEKEKWKDEQKKRKVFVSNIPSHIDNESLAEYFTQFGEVRNAFVIRDFASKASLNYGYVEFMDADVNERVLNLENLKLDGAELLCLPYQGKLQDRKLMVSTLQKKLAETEQGLQIPSFNSSQDVLNTNQLNKVLSHSDLPIISTKISKPTRKWQTVSSNTKLQVIGRSTLLNQELENYKFNIKLENPLRMANSYCRPSMRAYGTSAGLIKPVPNLHFGQPNNGESNRNGKPASSLSSGVVSSYTNQLVTPGSYIHPDSSRLFFPTFRLF